MCGFVGGTINDISRVEAALTKIRHRGPDSQHIEHVDGVSLGFARLAIIDTRAIADQPMHSPDGLVRLVFNGEIYGFARLRERLETEGYQFRTTSDTEVLLNAYLRWGEQFVHRVDGMFAICIHDRRTQKLLLFRDRAGIKPLYYHWDGKTFFFASELKAIQTAFGYGHLTIDQTAVYDFLTYRYVPSPKTLYQNVFQLSPAHQLVYRIGNQCLLEPTSYWSLPTDNDSHSELTPDEAVEKLQDLVLRSVRDQLVSDVPLGCFLSGGVDSSVIVSAATRFQPGLKTFTVGFKDESHSEVRFARAVAEQFRTNHREAILDDYGELLTPQHMVNWYDEPFADTSAFPTFLVSKVACQDATVVLSGDGGDELFGGYRWYQQFRFLRGFSGLAPSAVARRLAHVKHKLRPKSLLRRLTTLGHITSINKFGLYTLLMAGMTHEEKSLFADAWEIPQDYDSYWKFREYWRNDLPLLMRLQYLDFHTYLPDDILTKVDRVSMANSLEVRVPFLCRELVEFAFSLPERLRRPGSRPKQLLKNAFRSELPAEILDRAKQGFSLPLQIRDRSFLSTPETFLKHAFSHLIPTSIVDGGHVETGSRDGSDRAVS